MHVAMCHGVPRSAIRSILLDKVTEKTTPSMLTLYLGSTHISDPTAVDLRMNGNRRRSDFREPSCNRYHVAD